MGKSPAPAPQALVSTVRLASVSPWSAATVAFFGSLGLTLVGLLSAAALFLAVDSLGLITRIDAEITSIAGDTTFSFAEVATLPHVLMAVGVLGALSVALAPLVGLCFAGLYNTAGRFMGGLQLTFTAPPPPQVQASAGETFESRE